MMASTRSSFTIDRYTRSREMQIRPTEQTLKGPPERFTGDAWFDMIVTGFEPSRIRSSIVHFAP
jgi:hypothetical protein